MAASAANVVVGVTKVSPAQGPRSSCMDDQIGPDHLHKSRRRIARKSRHFILASFGNIAQRVEYPKIVRLQLAYGLREVVRVFEEPCIAWN
jgi:hypothetical protein